MITNLSLTLEYDPDARAAYLRLRQGPAAETEEIAPDVLMDVGDDGLPIGFEFLNPAAIWGTSLPAAERLTPQGGPEPGRQAS